MGNLPILSSKLNIFYLFFWKKSFCQKLDTFHVLYFYIVCFFSRLSSTLMILVEYLSWATMSAALETSLQGTRWFTKAEIQSIVRATFLGVLLDTGTVGTTPLTTLLTSTTCKFNDNNIKIFFFILTFFQRAVLV